MLEKIRIIRNKDKEGLLLAIKKQEPHIIGIDGEAGVGKSTEIAPFIRERLGGTVISIDDYLERDKGGYIDCLDYKSLCQKLSISVKQSEPLIIEGIMLLDVLEKAGVSQNYFIYACSSMWLDDWTSEYGNYFNLVSSEEIIKHEEGAVAIKIIRTKYQMAGEYQMPRVRKQIYEYTYRQKPFFRADAIWVS